MKHKFTHPKDTNEWHKWELSNGEAIEELHWFKGAKNRPTIAALSENGDIHLFDDDGCGMIGSLDIIDAPRTRTVWVNLNSDGICSVHTKKYIADGCPNRIACKRITITEGEYEA